MMITNSTLINEALNRIHSEFNTRYNVKGLGLSFLYLKQGMDRSEFEEASETLTQIISDYNELESVPEKE